MTQYRLSETIKPSQYQLLLRFNYDPFSSQAEPTSAKSLGYTGEVLIKIRSSQDTNQIVLHMDRNVVPDQLPTVVNSLTGQIIPVLSGSYANFQFYSILLGGCLQAGLDFNLTIKFTARTTRDGFYYHGYNEINQRE